MYINSDSIIHASTVVGALLALGTIAVAVIKWFMRQEEPHKEIEDLRETHVSDVSALKEELCVLSYATLATLDGLKQLGCNGEVSKAYNDLSKHLNKQAHDQLKER